VSSKITIVHTTVLPEGLFLIPSAALCEILVMKFSALRKQLLSRFVTSLKLSIIKTREELSRKHELTYVYGTETAKIGSR